MSQRNNEIPSEKKKRKNSSMEETSFISCATSMEEERETRKGKRERKGVSILTKVLSRQLV